MAARIAVIDYGGSNLRSVVKALELVAGKQTHVFVADSAASLDSADHVVFPGQGAIGSCMSRLQAADWVGAIVECAATKPFLGICLGLQSLMTTSDEDGGTACLDLYPGGVRHFTRNPPPAADGSPQKIPHMGWNEVHWTREHPLIEGIDSGRRFYFVHSYYVVPNDDSLTLGRTSYIDTFTSALACENVFASQFHPEKSAADGLRLLTNFAGWDGQS